MGAAVIGAEKAAIRRLDHGVDALRVRTGHAHVDAPENAGRQPVTRHVLPADSPIARTVEPTSRTSAREIPGLPPGLPQGCVDDARIMRIETDIDRTGVLILVEHLGPGLAAIGSAKYAALGIWSEGVAQCRDQHDVRIVRVDDQRPDLPRVPEADVAPGFTPIDRLVDAVSVSHVSAWSGFTGAHIDDGVIGRCDRNGAHRGDRRAVGQHLPGATAVGGLPHSARYGPEIKGAGIAGYAGNRERAPAAIRSDAAPLQRSKQARVHRSGGC